ncbi:fimbrial protein [Providencia rustigianii]|uniref:Fimbrial protein n=2 Tax=Providencia rustigianii TaxID=158850 RepID=D1P6X0_9GAMM|nr:fimbrial protein [Providencia rustigianii]EFB70817.1 fimbrial protein [Providencia rustigianii DSM 4541]SPY76418.1 putative fimbrial protein SthA [Providencia rustigianii]SUC25626.1 putative fimbrial protein SthA [Providencia rustigianii]SUC34382.1 putative fimbrial protein SthA [Providencia rustigianii]
MPRHILSLSIFSLSMISGSVLAATNSPGGIISFSGAISDTTCTINGGNSADMAIALDPIVPADAGTSANTVITKNQKTFALTFSNCALVGAGTPTGTLKLHFSSSTISPSGLYLMNTTANENDPSVARNVGFSLSQTTTPTVAIPLNSTFDTQLTAANTTSAAGSTLSLIASYYKTNATAAQVGALQSNVIYTVSYL